MKLKVLSTIPISIATIMATGLADMSFSNNPAQAALDCPIPGAVNGPNSYFWTHDFDAKPFNFPVNTVVNAGWADRVLAEAQSQNFPLVKQSILENGGIKVTNYGQINAPQMDMDQVKAQSGNARADAFAGINISAVGANLKSSHLVCGKIVFDENTYRRVISKASSEVRFQFGTQNARGQIKWKPEIHGDFLHDVKSRIRDPLDVSVLDLDTNQTSISRLLDIGFDSDDNSQISWQDGSVNLSGSNLTFYVNMTSPFITSSQGTLRLTFKDDIVSESEDTGIFDGLLPSVGSPANASFQIGDSQGDINIDYDFGSTNTNGYQFDIGLSGDGAIEVAIPEPNSILSLLALGTLGAASTLKRKQK